MSDDERDQPSEVAWRQALYVVIFRHDTRAGRAFDIALMLAIAASVGVVLLDSVAGVRARHGRALYAAEWVFTILFTLEYALRLVSVREPREYARSPLGLIDLASIAPTYLSLFVGGGAQALVVVRALRLLRVFRILKLPNYLSEASRLTAALRASRRKIIVFVLTVLTIVLIVGATMYLIEGPENGFTSIPVSMYWAIVTLTTVGYGDLAPRTALGQFVASAVMILGYGIIAVPTGIVTAELVNLERGAAVRAARRVCPVCGRTGHDGDASNCKYCGSELPALGT
jgi:voltage-gated potassium channel